VLHDPPPRLRWEEPPPGGWASHLSELLLETLRVALGLAAGAAAVRLALSAHRMGTAHPTGVRHVAAIAMWGACCLLAAAIGVFVWRRLGGLALVGAMLTDYGRVARLGGRPPVWLDAPPDGALRLAHLSDLHVTEGDDVRLVERASPGGNAALERLLDADAVTDADLVLITGDITDRGTAVSWRCFLDAVAERELNDRVVIVPGNHDLALVDPLDGERRREHALRSDRFAVVQLANLLKFCEAFAETAGGRRGMVLEGDELAPYEDVWTRVERSVRPFVADLPSRPVPPLRFANYREDRAARAAYEAPIEAAREQLFGLFPVAVPIPGHDAVLFVLNSCASVSRHPTTNALGRVGRAQYRRLDRLARYFAQRTKLVALHHHVVRRAEERGVAFLTRLLAKFTVLGDAQPLVRFCQTHGVRAVLNGHRHLSYQLKLPNGTVLLAAPSSTLGDELARDPRPQLERYAIAPDAEPPSVGIHRAWVHLDAQPEPAAAAAGVNGRARATSTSRL
jgi:Calcineurin-like phosphoesterase